jgi:hypothetical protein
MQATTSMLLLYKASTASPDAAKILRNARTHHLHGRYEGNNAKDQEDRPLLEAGGSGRGRFSRFHVDVGICHDGWTLSLSVAVFVVVVFASVCCVRAME